MTETEARTKRCCGPSDCGRLAYGVGPHGEAERGCVGARCMAWQWAVPPEVLALRKEMYPDDATAHVEDGYCGLARRH